MTPNLAFALAVRPGSFRTETEYGFKLDADSLRSHSVNLTLIRIAGRDLQPEQYIPTMRFVNHEGCIEVMPGQR